MSDWHKAIHDFYVKHGSDEGLAVDDYGSLTFQGIVDFASEKASAATATKVHICRNGYSEDGAIRLDETSRLTTAKHHTEFKPYPGMECEFQLADGSLLISGKSPKVGRYSVRIRLA